MGKKTIGNLNIEVNVQLAQMQVGLDQMNRRIQTATKKNTAAFASAGKVMTRMMQGVIATMSVGVVVAFGRSILKLGSDITDMAGRTGLSTDALQTLQAVTRDSGIGIEEHAQSLLLFRNVLAEAAAGTSDAIKKFKALGLSGELLARMPLERALEAVAVAMVNSTDKTAAYAHVVDLLGARNAPKLMEALKRLGIEGFDALNEKMAAFRLSPEQIKALDDFSDAVDKWKALAMAQAAKDVLTISSAIGGAWAWINRLIEDAAVALGNLDVSKMDIPWPIRDAVQVGKTPPPVVDIAAQDALARAARWTEEFDKNRVKTLGEYGQLVKKTSAVALKALEDEEEHWRGVADAITLSLHPAIAYERQIEQVRESFARTGGSAKDLAEAIRRINAAMADDEAQRIESALDKFFGNIDAMTGQTTELTAAAKDFGNAFSSAFEDAILAGDKFSDVIKGLAKDVLRLFVRQTISAPIATYFAGLFAGLFAGFGGGKAAGGPVKRGIPYIVGEEGPEVFVPGSSGKIVPNHDLSSSGSSGRGGGGGQYFIDARGADRTGLARLESMILALHGSIEHRAVAANFRAARRSA